MAIDDEKNRPGAGNQDPAFALGARVRRGLGSAVDAFRDAAVQTTVARAQPYARTLTTGLNFTAGLVGDEQPGTGRAAPAAPSASQKRAAPATPAAQAPAPPRSGARAALPTSATADEPIVGTFNGRQITRSAADRAARALPTVAGPVVAGPNGSFAASTDRAGAPAITRSLAVPQQGAPRIAGRNLRGDLRGAEQERAGAIRQLNDQIDRLSFGPGALNSRGERQLYAALVGERNRLTGQRVDQATTLEARGADNQSAESIADATLRQRGFDSAADRGLAAARFAAEDADRDARLASEETRANRTFLQQERQATQVSPDTEFRELRTELETLQDPLFAMQLDDAGRTRASQRIAEIRSRMAQLSGTGNGKTVKRRGTLNGRRVVEYTDGTTEFVD